jgi:dihydroxyacetone kinase-like protein
MKSVGYDRFVAMLRGGLDAVRAGEGRLSELDSATGDGDHGAAMLRIVKGAEEVIASGGAADAGALLEAVAWNTMTVAGGAAGPLLGSFFMGMGQAAGAKADLDTGALAGMLEAGLAGLREQTPAKPGDKTMLDALVPAVEAFRTAAAAGAGLSAAMQTAAQAADRGAQSTRPMQARFGKARNIGPRSIGTVDPGAMSVALLFRGFADALAGHGAP